MIEERSSRLLDALEGRTETLLGLLQEERRQRQALTGRLAELERRLAELEANRLVLQEERRELVEERRELVEENRELDEQNRELEEHNRHLHERLAGNAGEGGFPRPHRRSQGLSALIGRPAAERDASGKPPVGAREAAPPTSKPPESSLVGARFIGGPTFRRSERPEPTAESTEAPAGARSIGRDETQATSSTSGTPQEHDAPAPPPSTPQDSLPIGEAPSPQALLAEWYQRYGLAFFKGHTRPLQVGIHEALAAREPWPEKLVRRALACYVNLPRYLKAVREGAERIDLAGQPAGVVDAQAAEHARRKLDRLQADRQQRRGKAAGPGRVGQAAKPRAAGRKPAAPVADKAPAAKPAQAEAPAAPATLEEKLSALLAKHNGR
ncbi:ProQ/FINO family protein [Halomonas campaniensis]|uniref:ProQ/FINO family protein n=1 Tax=Halomonas campaniensis TaxID=213554 RepID=UPI00356816F1